MFIVLSRKSHNLLYPIQCVAKYLTNITSKALGIGHEIHCLDRCTHLWKFLHNRRLSQGTPGLVVESPKTVFQTTGGPRTCNSYIMIGNARIIIIIFLYNKHKTVGVRNMTKEVIFANILLK